MTENRLLKYFLVAAQEENITKAAEILHVSQPALSKQIMQLEEELGAKLFIRGKRSLTLTEEGRFLRGRAQEIVALTEKTERDFRDEGLLIEPAVDLSKYDFLRIPVQDRWGGRFRRTIRCSGRIRCLRKAGCARAVWKLRDRGHRDRRRFPAGAESQAKQKKSSHRPEGSRFRAFCTQIPLLTGSIFRRILDFSLYLGYNVVIHFC